MGFFKKHVDLAQFLKSILGNLATSLWFFPYLSKLCHSIRGIKFKNKSTVYIGRNVILDNRYPELVSIGNDVWITTGCIILAHSYCSDYQRKIYNINEKVGRVSICDGVFIGAGSIILPGITVGKGAYIAAGSIVTDNVPEGVLVGGNPAKIIKVFKNHHEE